MQNLISKANTAATLASIGIDKATSCIDVVTAQELDTKTEEDSSDGESNDGPSDQELEEDEKVSLLSDEEDKEATSGEVAADQTVDDKVMQASKPDRSTEDTFDEAPDDEDFIPGNDTKKKESKKHDNLLNFGSRDGPICLDPTVLATEQKQKCQADHVSIQVVQRSIRVYLFRYLGLIGDDMVLSTLFFHTDVMCKDGLVVPGGEWPSVDWMTDAPSLGAATRDMSWFVGFCCTLFPRV